MNFNSLIALILAISINTICLSVICFLGIKFSKIREINLINMKQYFYPMLTTVTISCFFPTILAAISFIVLFFFYRFVIFKKTAFQIQQIYELYGENMEFSPPITKISRVFCLDKTRKGTGRIKKEYLYTFDKYLNNTIYIFIFYCINEASGPETPILYGFEFFIAVTALFIMFAKLIYKLSVSTPSSLFFLCPNLSYIPVALIGLLFYIIAIFMFKSTL